MGKRRRMQRLLVRRAAAVFSTMTLSFCLAVPSPAEDAVKFSFAWPSKFQADVVWRIHIVEESYGKTKDTKNALEFSIVAHPVADGIRIDQRTSIAQKLVNLISSAGAAPTGARQHWLFVYPNFVVSGDGRFLRLENVDEYQKSLELGLRQYAKQSKLQPQQVDQVKALTEQALGADSVGRSVALDWNLAISAWNGGQLESDRPIEVGSTLRYPAGGEILPVPQRERYRLIGAVGCSERDARNSCVDVEATFVPDPDALRIVYDRAMASSMQGIMPAGRSPPSPKSAFSQSSVRMTTDPLTLLPYRIRFADEVRVQFVEPEEGYDTIDRKSEVTIEFKYRS